MMTTCQAAPVVSYNRVGGSLADLKVEEPAPYAGISYPHIGCLGRSAAILQLNSSGATDYQLAALRAAFEASVLKVRVPSSSAEGWDAYRLYDYIRSAAEALSKITWDTPIPSVFPRASFLSPILTVDPLVAYSAVFERSLGCRAAERLRTFSELGQGWDGRAAAALDMDSVRLAAEFLNAAGTSFDHLAVSVFMTFSGEIALNWPVAGGGFLEIQFGVDEIELSPPGVDAEELYFSPGDSSGLIQAVRQYL